MELVNPHHRGGTIASGQETGGRKDLRPASVLFRQRRGPGGGFDEAAKRGEQVGEGLPQRTEVDWFRSDS